MALVVLLAVGAVVGWIASILLRRDTLRLSVANMAIGAAGALLGSLALGFRPDPDGIAVETLLIGVAAAALAVTVVAFLQRGKTG